MVPLLLGAALLIGAGQSEPALHVEVVDLSAYPEVSVIASAPGQPVADPASAFDVRVAGQALPFDAAPVQAGAVEVVLVASPVPGSALPQVRSTVADLVLGLPPETRVSIIAAHERPEVLAGPGNTLEGRVVAANQVAPGEPALQEAVTLALGEFTSPEAMVRSIVVVGGPGEEAATHDDLAALLAERHVAFHAVQPGPDGADHLIARLSSLYRLTFEVSEGADEVTITFAADDRQAAGTLSFTAANSQGAAGESPAGVDSPTGGSRWGPVLLSVAAAGVMLLSASIVLPDVSAGRNRPERSGSWDRMGARVAWEIGGWDAVREAADWIDGQRRRSASEIRATGLQTRVAATVLAVQPVVAAALVLLVSRSDDAQAVAGTWPTGALAAAFLLAAAGAAWLHRVARPPFSAWPFRWRAHRRQSARRQYALDTLDLAHLYAAGGLPLDEALARGGAGWHEHPDRLLERGRDLTAGASPVDLLAASSTAVRAEQVASARSQARGGILAALVPFLVCSLPATLILLVTAGVSLPGG